MRFRELVKDVVFLLLADRCLDFNVLAFFDFFRLRLGIDAMVRFDRNLSCEKKQNA